MQSDVIVLSSGEDKKDSDRETGSEDEDFSVEGGGISKEGQKDKRKQKANNAKKCKHYAIPAANVGPLLTQQLEDFTKWMSQPINLFRQMPYFETATIEKSVGEIRRVLGYLHYQENVDIEELNMNSLLDLNVIERYLDWLMNTRGLQPQTIVTILTTVINTIKVCV